MGQSMNATSSGLGGELEALQRIFAATEKSYRSTDRAQTWQRGLMTTQVPAAYKDFSHQPATLEVCIQIWSAACLIERGVMKAGGGFIDEFGRMIFFWKHYMEH